MQHDRKTPHMLTIGEFAAATQLTPKALRLYDEQDLLRPAAITASGYRHYAIEQVPTARLIRFLRDMDLSLQQIGHVLRAERVEGELLLTEYVRDTDERYARARRAYQGALLTMRAATRRQPIAIEEQSSEAQLVSIWPFTADRTTFVDRYLEAMHAAFADLELISTGYARSSWCVLVEPLTDDEGALELLIPITANGESLATGITTRLFPNLTYAAVEIPGTDPAAITAALDGIFDWLDNRGANAVGSPQIQLMDLNNTLRPKVRWAYSFSKGAEP